MILNITTILIQSLSLEECWVSFQLVDEEDGRQSSPCWPLGLHFQSLIKFRKEVKIGLSRIFEVQICGPKIESTFFWNVQFCLHQNCTLLFLYLFFVNDILETSEWEPLNVILWGHYESRVEHEVFVTMHWENWKKYRREAEGHLQIPTTALFSKVGCFENNSDYLRISMMKPGGVGKLDTSIYLTHINKLL